MKSKKYAVGEGWMICDEETQEWVNGIITEVGDETVCIKWEDLPEETEYRIDDMPRIFRDNEDKGLNHPIYGELLKFIEKYPHLKPHFTTPPHREGEFAEWVNNKWHRMEDGKWEQIGNMKNMHPYGETLRTSELYQMWLSTRANNAQVQVENLPNNLSQAITQDN